MERADVAKQNFEFHGSGIRISGSGQLCTGGDHSQFSQQPVGRNGGIRSKGFAIRGGAMEVEMKIRGLMMDPVTNMPIVILKDNSGDAVLPIWVGIYEANAIALEIEKV